MSKLEIIARPVHALGLMQLPTIALVESCARSHVKMFIAYNNAIKHCTMVQVIFLKKYYGVKVKGYGLPINYFSRY